MAAAPLPTLRRSLSALDAHAADAASFSAAVRDLGRVGEADLDDRRAEAGLELRRGALRDHRAVVDDDDLVRQAIGLLEVLRRQQHGVPAADELLDHAPEIGAAWRVEPGRRLVEEEHRRLVHERGREVEPAAHPAGERAQRDGRPRRDAEALEELVDPLRDARPSECA